ncbi:transcriptional regulator [Corynebacterium suranareeae]|uniref:Transcriptional regulator n=1 Tax=Corynebacterium suranareeae TaxID=2506452 RepID=A0A160PUW1_9CORY|nr:MerR family transcriptional regulator [Corynebacterium suranareeae]BAU96951.1 transcriptional regulator [Corynebacterium suranareeae]
MTDRTIGEAAELLGVTTRTLRHWDDIGLLQPSWRTTTDYRLYTEDDVERGLQILIYKAAGIALKDIAAVLDQPDSASGHMRRQRELLVEQIGQLHRMVRAVDEILRKDAMSVKDKIEIFGEDLPKYEEEAFQRWGDTPEWAESQKIQERMTKEDFQRVKDEHEGFVEKLIDASRRHIAPGSPEGNELVLAHRASIGQWYTVSPSKQVILARMYVDDERFNETYRGQAEYLLTLVEALAQVEGVDLENVEWE